MTSYYYCYCITFPFPHSSLKFFLNHFSVFLSFDIDFKRIWFFFMAAEIWFCNERRKERKSKQTKQTKNKKLKINKKKNNISLFHHRIWERKKQNKIKQTLKCHIASVYFSCVLSVWMFLDNAFIFELGKKIMMPVFFSFFFLSGFFFVHFPSLPFFLLPSAYTN